MLFVCHWEANKKKKKNQKNDFWAYYINFFGVGMIYPKRRRSFSPLLKTIFQSWKHPQE